MLIDTHCHLNFKAFNKDLPKVIKRAKDANVEKIIIPGTKLDSSKQAIKIAQEYPSCFAAVGIHPHHMNEFIEKGIEVVKKELTQLTTQPKVVALGEIGLDYYQYKNYPPISETDKKKQKELLITQIKIAQKKNLPVIIHCQKAHDDLLDLLDNYIKTSKKSLSGVFHCFAGNKSHLNKVLNLGFFVGFDGNITYPENKHLRKLIRLIPLNRLLLETDAPFLTPIPHRSKRNEPLYLPFIALKIAEIKKETLERVAEITSSNATKLFHL